MSENEKKKCEFGERKEPHMHCRFCHAPYSMEEAVLFAATDTACKSCGKTQKDADEAEKQQAELEGRAVIEFLRGILGDKGGTVRGMLVNPNTGEVIALNDMPKRLN